MPTDVFYYVPSSQLSWENNVVVSPCLPHRSETVFGPIQETAVARFIVPSSLVTSYDTHRKIAKGAILLPGTPRQIINYSMAN